MTTPHNKIRIAVIDSHPIQYRAPLWRMLAAHPDIDLKCLFYFAGGSSEPHHDEDFGQQIKWDIPLLEGYPYEIMLKKSDFHLTPKQEIALARAISKQIRNFIPDAVLMVGIKPFLLYTSILALLRVRGTPLFFLGESNQESRGNGARTPLNRMAWMVLLRQYSAVFCIGQKNRLFLRHHGVPPARLFYAPYSVENERFQSGYRESLAKRKTMLADLALPADSRGFIFCGKFTHKKRVREILRAYAASSLAASHHLIFVGSGPLEDDLRHMVQRQGLEKVRFLGFVNQSEMPRVYSLADFLILVSDPTETWGLVVNEAMACGLPCIVAESCGCAPDLIIPGRTGWRVPLDNHQALIQAMQEAASLSQEQYLSISLGARKHISRYSFKHMVDGIAAAVHFVVNNSRL
ncbi:MAG: glycosyltransferase family 4 protein [Deltaproteobacteria bacterium]|nr:glycosyltransferase family 4 protein [Deltaproteobacteria bacterium]MBM4286864.1 glycosyltransferase family 4 protein [Deltaproteobacteria bacterium]